MTDRELLEAAAKAAGIDLCWFEVGEGDPDCDPGWYCSNVTNGGMWNPLTDDGDALRLVVTLRLTVADEPNRGGWSVGAIVDAEDGEFRWLAHDDDCLRAIVKAAATIGEVR